MTRWLALLLVVTTSGCPDVQTDPGEGETRPTVEFDPGNRIVPFPNNLLLDRATGDVKLPASCNESASGKALREGVLNALDGFGTYQTAMSVTLTAPVDATAAADHVVLLKRATNGAPVDPASALPIPVAVFPGTSVRFANQTANADGTVTCDDPGPVDSLTIVPRVPLDQRSTYVVAIKTGLVTTGGVPYAPSFTWSLVRQLDNPVTLDDQGNVVSDRTPLDPATPEGLASLLGLDLLWKAHAPALAFLEATGHPRGEVVLAWEFNTQTVQDPLDPAVVGSPASQLDTTPPLRGPTGTGTPVSPAAAAANRTIFPWKICTDGATAGAMTAAPEASNVQCFMKLALGGGLGCTSTATCSAPFVIGTATCSAIGGPNATTGQCTAVSNVLAGALIAKQFQTETPNPRGDVCGAAMNEPCPPVPGLWDDPITPTAVGNAGIGALAFVPRAVCPAAGCTTVAFGHGLGSSKNTLFAIAVQLASQGFQSVAIDFVAHDSRAVRISTAASTGCDTLPPFGAAPQCFAPFLSANLGVTRDNIRQSVLDMQSLARSLATCGVTMCGPLLVNPARILYLGISLGGIMGSVVTATAPDIKAAVLNVPGAGWVDILENTATLAIRCSLVDGLIDAGVVAGAKYDTLGTPDPADDTGLCVGDDWKSQPGYRQFSAIARWVLDPADPASFARRLAQKRFLIQEVVDDQVVPNIATDRLALLTGLTTPLTADPQTSATPNASAAITMDGMTNKFVKYPTIMTPAPNTFGHSSLLRPPPGSGMAGQLGTLRVQTDAITYLLINR